MLLAKLCSSASMALRPARSARLPPRRALEAPGLARPPARHFNLGLKSQYDNNAIPNRLKMSYAAVHYWEVIPLFLVCAFDIFIVVAAIAYSMKSRVDLQFSHGQKKNTSISRNMDMNNPTIHKHLVLYQRYEPWPELQVVLDKMSLAELRAKRRSEDCAQVD